MHGTVRESDILLLYCCLEIFLSSIIVIVIANYHQYGATATVFCTRMLCYFYISRVSIIVRLLELGARVLLLRTRFLNASIPLGE